MNILKEGVKSALVRIVRLIVYSLIVLVVFYIIGLITSHKASALTMKGQDRTTLDSGSSANQGWTAFTGSDGNNPNHWFGWEFSSQIQTPQGVSLIGFTFTDLEYFVTAAGVNTWGSTGGNNSTNLYSNYIDTNGNLVTFTGVMFDSNDVAHLCWLSSEVSNTFLCSVSPGDLVDRFFVITNVSMPNDHYSTVRLTLDIVKTWWAYDNTDVITQQQTIITQQQQTNNYIQDNSTTGSQTQAENSLNTISGQFNDVLNGWGGEWSDVTHIVLEPINVMLYVLDPSTACRPITLTVPFVNTTVTLPCYGAAFSQFFPTLMSLVVIIFSGLYGYRTVMYIIRTLKGVLDAEDDKIEVIDL